MLDCLYTGIELPIDGSETRDLTYYAGYKCAKVTLQQPADPGSRLWGRLICKVNLYVSTDGNDSVLANAQIIMISAFTRQIFTGMVLSESTYNVVAIFLCWSAMYAVSVRYWSQLWS